MIPLLEPAYINQAIANVNVSLVNNNVAIGPHLDEFEYRIATLVKAKYAIAVSSGTAALHLAMLASSVEQGDEVVMPLLSFVASANVVRYIGAYPWFIDTDEFCQMDAMALVDFLKEGCRITKKGIFYNKQTGRRVRAIMPVHLLGHPTTHIDKIVESAREIGLFVIEDCAQGLGARWKDTSVGNFGDIACFSFNGNKLITCGGGGMVVTNSEIIATKVRALANQFKLPSEHYTFWHDRIGYNYRMPNILAAIGCSQLDNLERIITKKRAIRQMYRTYLEDLGVLGEHPDAFSTHWLNVIFNDNNTSGRKTAKKLRERGIEARQLYTPMNLFPMYKECCNLVETKAAAAHNSTLLVPSSVTLELEQVKHICSVIKEAI